MNYFLIQLKKTEKIIRSMAKESLLYLEVNGTILNYKLDLNSLLTPHVYFKQIYVNLRFINSPNKYLNSIDCLYSSKGQINATRITAIAVGQDDSDIVEVRTRIFPHQTYDLRCDVVVNGKTYYLNYTEEKVQIFKSKFLKSTKTKLYIRIWLLQ